MSAFMDIRDDVGKKVHLGKTLKRTCDGNKLQLVAKVTRTLVSSVSKPSQQQCLRY